MALLERDNSFYDETEGYNDYAASDNTQRDDEFGERITYAGQPDGTDPIDETGDMDLSDGDQTMGDTSTGTTEGFRERLSTDGTTAENMGMDDESGDTLETGDSSSTTLRSDDDGMPTASMDDRR